jgi:hypothetical protein
MADGRKQNAESRSYKLYDLRSVVAEFLNLKSKI